MTDDGYLLEKLVQALSRQVVACFWEESSCPMECGEPGQVLFFIYGDGGMACRCSGCRQDSYLAVNDWGVLWEYVATGFEHGMPWAVISRW